MMLTHYMQENRRVDAVMVIAREVMALILEQGLSMLPADIIDVWPTRDCDFVVLLSGNVPAQQVMAVVRRGEDGITRFEEWV